MLLKTLLPGHLVNGAIRLAIRETTSFKIGCGIGGVNWETKWAGNSTFIFSAQSKLWRGI